MHSLGKHKTTCTYMVMQYSFGSSFGSNNETKRWADYEDDDLLPIIPWAPHVKQVSLKSEPSEWTTVKSKKKRR